MRYLWMIGMRSWEVEEDVEAQRRRKELGFFLAEETENGCATEGRGTRVETGYEDASKDNPESAQDQARR